MSVLHALTVDVEDWFQVLNLRGTIPRSSWEEIPLRCPEATAMILDLLDRRGARATFFFLGWIAERAPELVERVAAAGHEVASHGYDHKTVEELGPEGFLADLRRTRAILEGITGRPVEGYRACSWSITASTAWALECLAGEGVAFDSSIFPVRHPDYGLPSAPARLHRRRTAAGTLVEFPPTTLRLLGRNLPVGGGGYLRLLPSFLCAAALRRAEKGGTPGCVYVHPWEFDPGQPRVQAPPIKRFRHYVNLHKTARRLDALLRRFRFGTMREAIAGAGDLPLLG